MALTDYARAAVYSVPEWVNFPEVKDQGLLFQPFLRAARAFNMIREEPAGKELLATILLKANPAINVTDPVSSDFLNFATSAAGDTIADYFSNARYLWYMKYGRIIIPERDIEELQNEERRVRAYIDNVLRVSMQSWMRAVENDLWGIQAAGWVHPQSGGSANEPWGSATRPPNLLYWIDGWWPHTAPNRGFYPYDNTVPFQNIWSSATAFKAPGDIARGHDGTNRINPWWEALLIRPTTAEQLTWQRFVHPMVRVSAAGESEPDMVLVPPGVISWLQNLGIGSQRYVNVKTAAEGTFGFTAFNIVNASVIPIVHLENITAVGASDGSNANAGRNTMLYLNSQRLRLFLSDRFTAEPVELPHPIRFWKMHAYVGMWADSMRAHARYSNWFL